jgi:DNA-binding transcriptional MerR regulator
LVEQLLRLDPGASGEAVPKRRLLVIDLARNIHFRLLLFACKKRKPHCAISSRLEVKRVRDLDITEVAQRSGVPASTLRFYDEKRLIASTGRRGLRRLFDPGVLERLALITLGRAAGFSLDEIALMFAPDGRPRIDRQMLAAKAQELDGTIRKLTAMRDGLRHAAACPKPSQMECPTFRRILRAASSRAIGARKKRAPQPPFGRARQWT